MRYNDDYNNNDNKAIKDFYERRLGGDYDSTSDYQKSKAETLYKQYQENLFYKNWYDDLMW